LLKSAEFLRNLSGSLVALLDNHLEIGGGRYSQRRAIARYCSDQIT
jgi:hypothetical protein